MANVSERELISVIKRRAFERAVHPGVSTTERLQAVMCILICADLIGDDDDDN